MRPILRGLVAAAIVIMPATSPAIAGEVSFQKQIVPILKRRCATCHLTGEEPGSMALHPRAAHAALVNAPSDESDLLRVEPGSPEKSYLFHKLEGTQLEVGGSGEPMPLEGWPLPAEEIALFKAWIEQGAADN